MLTSWFLFSAKIVQKRNKRENINYNNIAVSGKLWAFEFENNLILTSFLSREIPCSRQYIEQVIHFFYKRNINSVMYILFLTTTSIKEKRGGWEIYNILNELHATQFTVLNIFFRLLFFFPVSLWVQKPAFRKSISFFSLCQGKCKSIYMKIFTGVIFFIPYSFYIIKNYFSTEDKFLFFFFSFPFFNLCVMINISSYFFPTKHSSKVHKIIFFFFSFLCI